jgi:hypothetical protein
LLSFRFRSLPLAFVSFMFAFSLPHLKLGSVPLTLRLFSCPPIPSPPH